ncbi:MAG: hypothetical protein NVV59_18400 [Chitinophagaceae bacterium]|nr:hypothetical protein [Chitinophagaceae bacterium]
MKKLLIPAAIVLTLAACNNADTAAKDDKAPKTPIEMLKKEIDDIHIIGMSKMGRLNTLQQHTQRFIDSLSNLPGKMNDATLSLRAQADSLLNELNYADYAMNTWMPEFYSHTDTLLDKPDQLLEYLKSEKEKATKVTDAIVEGVKKAEALLKK